jgi:hypothetical protein
MSFNLSHHFIYIINRNNNDFEVITSFPEATNKSTNGIIEVHSIKFNKIVGKYEKNDNHWKYVDYDVLEEGAKYFE